jgi:hypothetical protein
MCTRIINTSVGIEIPKNMSTVLNVLKLNPRVAVQIPDCESLIFHVRVTSQISADSNECAVN